MFLAVMEGRARAAKGEFDLAVLTAWHGEAFARQKKLKGLSQYLAPEDQGEPTPPEMILDAMLTLQSMGVPMDIKKLN